MSNFKFVMKPGKCSNIAADCVQVNLVSPYRGNLYTDVGHISVN